MITRRMLFFIPLFLILFLLQSYFWVPTFEEQTRGNRGRLKEYITASIGDAALLNPILLSDTASGEIAEMVFDPLVDYDEDLHFRGRLAKSWDIYEEAFFYVNDSQDVPGLGKASAEDLVELLQRAKAGHIQVSSGTRSSLDNIRDISVIPPRDFHVKKAEREGTGGPGHGTIDIHVKAPARIRLTLNKVDQDLFQNLTDILGNDFFASFNGGRYITTEPEINGDSLAKLAREILPPAEHNPVMVFHLRPNVAFHDGHVLDCRDVKFTYEAIMDPRNLSPRVSDFEPVKSVEIIDPLTVRVTYKRLYSPALSTWGMGILPEHRLNREALRKEALSLGKDPDDYSIRQSLFNRHPLGCGPFVFREWKSDQFIRLDRFDNYWEGAPQYNRYFFRVIPDRLTQEMEFYAGTIDAYGGGSPPSGIPPHQVDRLTHDPRYQSFSGLQLGYTYIAYNMRRKPFDDPRVRMALGMAIDVDKIIKYVLYGQGERITGPFAKQTDYYNQDVKPVPYDPEGALKLLGEAGWKPNREGWLEKDGKRLQFTLIANQGNDIRKAILSIAQDAWKKIGIDVRTDLLEWSVFIQERVDKADFDALVLGWSMGIEPDLYQIWHSSQTNPNQLNFAGFRNREADDLIVRIRQEYDRSKQIEYCHRLHEIIAREQPYTFLYVARWTAILDKRIVLEETDARGNPVYKKIKQTRSGDFYFHFNQWIKLPREPNFTS